MTVTATVVWRERDGNKGLGRFAFCSLPTCGEQMSIGIPVAAGDRWIFECVGVEHVPVNASPDTVAGRWALEQGPSAYIYVKFVRPLDTGFSGTGVAPE